MDPPYHQRLFSHYFLGPDEEHHFNGYSRDDGYYISFAVLSNSPVCECTVIHIAMSERVSWRHPCVTTSVFAVLDNGCVTAWMTEDEVDRDVGLLLEASEADAWIDAEMCGPTTPLTASAAL